MPENQPFRVSFDSTVFRVDPSGQSWPGESWNLFVNKIRKNFTHVAGRLCNDAPVEFYIRTENSLNHVQERLDAARASALEDTNRGAYAPTIALSYQEYRVELQPDTFTNPEQFEQFTRRLNALAGVNNITILDDDIYALEVDLNGGFDPDSVLALVEEIRNGQAATLANPT